MKSTVPPTQRLTNQNNEVTRIADFVLDYGGNLYTPLQRPQIEAFIRQHMIFGTLLVVRRRHEIVAVCRWNFLNTDTVKILDLIIKPDHRRKSVMKSMLVQGLMVFPYVTKMVFHRKKHNRDTACLVSKFIGGK